MRNSTTAGAALLVLLLWASPQPGNAQTGNQASMDGLASDPSGAVIAGAQVSVRHLDTGATFSSSTNEEGLFRFPVLPVGTYLVRAERAGFATLVFENVELRVGSRVTLPLSFRVATQTADVTVRGEAPLIETSRTEVSAAVDNHAIARLPVNGRDFTSFALVLPGVTTDVRGGLSFGGQRAMNSLLVDGTSSTDGFWGQAFGGEGFPVIPGQSGYHVSLEAVQEFQVHSNAYSAETGRAGGGVVNAITKSGTDVFHGTAFEFYRDKSLNATSVVDNMFGLPKDPFHFNQFGGVLGGPIIQRTSSFFFSYDGVRSVIANGVSLNLPPGFHISSDPTTAAFQQRALDYLAARAGSWSFPFRQDDWLTKVDWQLTPGHALSIRWIRQEGDAAFPGFPQQSLENAVPTNGPTDITAASLTSTLSRSLVNVARFAYVTSEFRVLAGAAVPQADVFDQGVRVLIVGRSRMAPQDFGTERVQLADTLSWVRGRHAFKVGTDLLLDGLTYYTAQNFAGGYRFLSLASFGESLAKTPQPRAGESFLQAFSGFGTPGVTMHPDTNDYAAFVQDEWRMRPNVTLNAGVRYDLQVIAKPPVKNPSPDLAAAGLDTSFRPIDATHVAPRLGLAWSPSPNHRLVVRAGYGVFYAPTISVMSARAHFLNGISVQPRFFNGGTPAAAFIPAYPNTVCGPSDPSGVAPSCPPTSMGATKPFLMFFSPRYRKPYTQQGSVGFEFAPRDDFTIALSYLFVKGSHLPWIRDINLATPTTPATIGVASTSTRLTYQKYIFPRPFADFDRISLFDSNGSSVFHGLAVQVNKRFSRNYQYLLSYTLSKTIDDNPNVYAVNPGNGDPLLLSDPLNPREDRSASVNDQRHRLVLSGTWQLNYANSLPQTGRALLGGWDVSGILTAQSGRPYSGLVNADLNNDGNFQTDRTPGLGRNSFYLPALVSLDLRLVRSLSLGSPAKMQIILEAFNALNHPNVNAVNTTQYAVIDSPASCGVAGAPCLAPQDTGLTAFGTPTATAGPRIVQLGVKVSF